MTPALQRLIHCYVTFCFEPNNIRRYRGKRSICKVDFERAVGYCDKEYLEMFNAYDIDHGGLYVSHDDFIEEIIKMNVGYKSESGPMTEIIPRQHIHHFKFSTQYKLLQSRFQAKGWYWKYFIETDLLAKLIFGGKE